MGRAPGLLLIGLDVHFLTFAEHCIKLQKVFCNLRGYMLRFQEEKRGAAAFYTVPRAIHNEDSIRLGRGKEWKEGHVGNHQIKTPQKHDRGMMKKCSWP